MAHQFKDAEGREWSLSVDIGATKRVKQTLGLDLLAEVDDVLVKLGDDPILLVDVLYVLCRPQADALKISDEDFGGALNGEAIESASLALMQEIVDFFPPRKKAALRKLLDKSQDLALRTLDLMDQRIDSLDPEKMVSKIKAQLEAADAARENATPQNGTPSSPPPNGPATAGATSTSSPASSESTPTA